MPFPSLIALAVEGALGFAFPSETSFDPLVLDFDGLSTTAGTGVGAGTEGEDSVGGAAGAETGTDLAGCFAAGLDCAPGDTAI
ncbi:MAG TPA: hypothetical protein VIY71_00385 [Solirubrobacterales bacterium]